MKFRNLALIALRGYQKFLSPLSPPRCRFHPSCSKYAEGCYENHPLFKATWLVLKRLLKCHPFHPGGIDSVPTHS